MLFDKDEDGVLTFPELNVVMKSLGQRPSEKDLLKMVRDVSEDQVSEGIYRECFRGGVRLGGEFRVPRT